MQRHIIDILAATPAQPAVPGGRPLTIKEIRTQWHRTSSERMRRLIDATPDADLMRRTPERMRYEGGRVPVPAQPPAWVTLRDMVGDDAPAAKVESYRRAIHKLAAAGKVETALVVCDVPVRTNSRWGSPVSILPRDVLAARLTAHELDETA